MIELTKEYIEHLREVIELKDETAAVNMLQELYPADIAELFQELDLEEAIYLYMLMDGEKAADVLMELDEEDRRKLLKELPSELIAKRFIDFMETDDAVDLMRELDEDTQEEILSHIEDVEQAGDIVDLLKYDEDTAGGLMGTEMIVVNENWSMPKCLEEMRSQAEEMDEIYYVYVVDDDERLRGVLPLKKMITSPSVSKIKHVMKKDPIAVKDSDSIEEVAQTIEKYDLVALPVIDSIGRLVGRITIDDVMDEVREQHERDYQLASGISQDVESSDTIWDQTKARLPWLIILLGLGLVVSSVVGLFEGVVAQLTIVICFQSLILDMAGNVGTQSLAVTIRVLMDETLTGKQKLFLLVKEMKIGLLNGGILGIMALALLGIYIHLFKGYTWIGAFGISGCVGISLLVAMVISSLVGTVIPMFFHKIKIDPAVASGPLITTVNDLVAVVTYYGLAFLLLIM